jgi:acetyl-CoA/propionyl-CoA carboxylase biotin carboxyl carrier protein
VEFIVSGDAPEEAYFLEMNTRLQVEHPVTEMVLGVDLVEQQLRIAAGEPLALELRDLRLRGHAIEARVYAEDPAHGFLPTGGTVRLLREPDDLAHVRVDSSLLAGTDVGTSYDPMLAKIVAWGEDRDTARHRLDRALAATCILGVTTNVAFLRTLLADPHVVAGDLDTGLVERIAAELPAALLPTEVAIAAALHRTAFSVPDPVDDPWLDRRGWRVGPSAAWTWTASRSDGSTVEVRLRASTSGWDAAVDGGAPARVDATRAGDEIRIVVDGEETTLLVTTEGRTTWLGSGGSAWAVTEPEPAAPGAGARPGGETTIRSPMPGTVVALEVKPGDRVDDGQPVVVVEAMKMEHTLRAPFAAVVHEVRVGIGDLVALDQVLVVLEAVEAA